MTAVISITESSRLEKLEAVIQRGLSNFVEVGKALVEIRDGKLYRESHATFEDYCRDKWNMAQQSATRFMRAAETVTVLKSEPIGSLPLTESQARPLTALEPEARREAWEAAKTAAAAEGKPLAARHVEAAVEQRKPKAKRNGAVPAVDPAPVCPVCGEYIEREQPTEKTSQGVAHATCCEKLTSDDKGDPVWLEADHWEHANAQQRQAIMRGHFADWDDASRGQFLDEIIQNFRLLFIAAIARAK